MKLEEGGHCISLKPLGKWNITKINERWKVFFSDFETALFIQYILASCIICVWIIVFFASPPDFHFLLNIFLPQRNCRSSENPNEVFRFLVEEKLKCLATEKVKYTQRVDYIMQLPVPMEAALNKGGSTFINHL